MKMYYTFQTLQNIRARFYKAINFDLTFLCSIIGSYSRTSGDMQKQAYSSTTLHGGGGGSGRVEQIYNAHDRLERSLARLKALVELYEQQTKSDCTFEVWDELRDAATGARADLVLCLRLFSGQRRLLGFGGLSTVSTLYAVNKAIPERVVNFIDLLRPSFAGLVPLPVIAIAARLVQRDNSREAYKFLHTYTSEILDRLVSVGIDSQKSLLNVMYSTDNARRRDFIGLLTLEAECNSTMDRSNDTSNADFFEGSQDKLASYLGRETVDKIIQYYYDCKKVLPAQHTQLKNQSIYQQTSIANTPGNVSVIQRDAAAKLADCTDGHASTKLPTGKEAATPLSGYRSNTLYERILNPFNLNGWGLHASRAVIVAILLVVLKIGIFKLVKAVQSIRGVTRSTMRGRSRTLSI